MPQVLFLHPFRQLNEFREAQINPSIVVIIIILTIIFFLSGCLHLLIRCLVIRHPRTDPNSIVTLTALQGQLQQLFHLHDSGVEQAFIDTLPVFFYKSVKGLKEGADCAVCLCEFEGEDRLRLLPKCSHAFHMDCIDRWLLSHSTCPLCRRSLLLPDEMGVARAHQQGLLLDSSRSSADGETLMRTGGGGEHNEASNGGATWPADEYNGAVGPNASQSPETVSLNKSNGEISVDENATVSFPAGDTQSQYAGKVLTVQLGRFRVVEGNPNPNRAGTSSSIAGSRRSYSVGSYEYVLDPANLEVVIAPTPLRKRSNTPRRLPSPAGHRSTLSDCNPEDVLPDPVVTPFVDPFSLHTPKFPAFPLRSRALRSVDHEPNWVSIDLNNSPPMQDSLKLPYPDNKLISSSSTASSRRAFSFRLPLSHDSMKLKISASRRTLSEAEVCSGGGGNGNLEDHRSFSGAQLVSESTELSNYSVPPLTSLTSASVIRGAAGAPYYFAKRTFNWLVGKQPKWTTAPAISFHDNPVQPASSATS